MENIDYKKLYFTLFNKITDAVEAIDACRFIDARNILIEVQNQAEEEYLQMEDE